MPVTDSPHSGDSPGDLATKQRHTLELALQRFVEATDSEALHDLRVALRRLGSLLRIINTSQYGSYQRLRPIIKATNRARDLEVFTQILQQSNLTQPRLEVAWQQQLRAEIQHLRQTLPEHWRLADAELSEHQFNEQNFRQLAAERLRRDILRLQRRREQLCRAWNDRLAHKLRISGKQIRYLLEIFAAENTNIEQCVAELKSFQDLLGEYHDYAALLAAPELNSDEVQNMAKILKNKMDHLRKSFTTDHCQPQQLDRALGEALQALPVPIQKKNIYVV